MSRESMEFDVIVVGAGPAGLATACRLAQLAHESGREVSICVVEKGASVGAHIVSGAVFDSRPLDELFPDWRERDAPVKTEVTSDALHWLRDAERSSPVEERWVPRALFNDGHYVVSLGDLCRWLGEQAEVLGCNVLPGFAAVDVLYDNGRVAGLIDEVIRESRSPLHVTRLPYVGDLILAQHRH